ncbi:MAG: hypothetical protein V9H69_07585 [Anaerolineae bacterium]
MTHNVFQAQRLAHRVALHAGWAADRGGRRVTPSSTAARRPAHGGLSCAARSVY